MTKKRTKRPSSYNQSWEAYCDILVQIYWVWSENKKLRFGQILTSLFPNLYDLYWIENDDLANKLLESRKPPSKRRVSKKT